VYEKQFIKCWFNEGKTNSLTQLATCFKGVDNDKGKGKGEGKGHPRTGHEGPEGE
jgi:hypothetical protein